MNKKPIIRSAVCTCLAASLALMAACGTGSNPGGSTNTTSETRPLKIATTTPDGVFNPFFATSAIDTSILSMTQISMLNSDKNGSIVCGENEPTVAKDYSVRTVTESGSQYTYYQFIIKKDIRFSDGEELTINDVLFNLYLYLDPAYSGSATIYSTDIVGLNAYRTQDESATDDYAESFEEQFEQEASMRIDDLVNYVYYYSDYTLPADKNTLAASMESVDLEQAAADFLTVASTFRDELESDWNTISADLSTYTTTYGFTDIWQVFLVNDGGFDLYQKNSDGTYVKDSNGNYIFDPGGEETVSCLNNMEEWMTENSKSSSDADAVKEWALEYVYGCYIGDSVALTFGSNFEMVVRYWETASTILSRFTAEAKEEYYKQFSGGLVVPTITGITALKGNAFVSSSESSASKYDSSYDMLQIKINGVDPKAIYNFAFTVAPLHYYSSHSYTSTRTGKTTDLIASFDAETGNFGVAYGETGFMNDVVNAADKVGLPVGAGVYMATNSAGSDSETGGSFFNNNIVYFKRNPYFETVGTGLSNAKIKYLRYYVVNSDQIVNSLNTGEIDYGEPSATQENMGQLHSNITQLTAETNGYGYVGVNARFVPNINVRRAIMKAMNLSLITDNYYKGGLAEIIYRSMSKTSWAYPDGATTYVAKDGTSYAYDSTGIEIQALLDSLQSEGYIKNSSGIYTNGTDTLDYTFTIAGGSTDHPAYAMFIQAANILNNKCEGIHVTVVTSNTALSDLANGKLTVWAAAWTSAIDPDLYQVYHKDSTATSTKNWGYDYIKAGKNSTYAYEWSIVRTLSDLIDDARETTDQDERAAIYSVALDWIMELAVELPTYQRKDLFAFNSNVLDVATMQTGDDLSPYNGPLARIWEVDYVAS